MVTRDFWKDASAKLCNPGKPYFLKLVVRCVPEVNLQRDGVALNFARKAMIISALSLNRRGLSKIWQFIPALQKILKKHLSVIDASRAPAIDQ